MSKSYAVKEMYYTLQGEGAQSGRPAVFVRFSGCNLWSGREADRHTAICKFCDTDFWGTDGTGGGRYTSGQLVEAILSIWPDHSEMKPYVVCTGGEPMLQVDDELIDAMHARGIEIAVETNGTLDVPETIDWICMSPKAGTDIVVRSGNEIKIVYPQDGLDPLSFQDFDFEYFFIQPMECPEWEATTKASIEFCKKHPKWRLSVQSHKYLNIP